jgi:hypothetical protein
MSILLAFVPFLVFALAGRLVGATGGLMAGSAASIALLVRAALSPGRAVKVLELGTTLLFCGLSLRMVLSRPTWSIVGIRLRVDIGLLLVVLVSMAIRRPFTMQYAREQVPREYWHGAEFVRVNYIMTTVWSLAFAVMVMADLLLLRVSGLSSGIGITATVLALVGAAQFTRWYPSQRRVSVARR